MIMKNPGQVLLTKEEAVTLRMFLKELSCPDSKVSCDICPFFLKQTNVCIAGYLRGLAMTGHIVERKKRDEKH